MFIEAAVAKNKVYQCRICKAFDFSELKWYKDRADAGRTFSFFIKKGRNYILMS